VAGGTFAVTVNCTDGVTRPVMNLANGGSAVTQARLGSTCTITEADPGATVIGSGNTNTAVIAPSNFVVERAQTVNITNRIEAGTFPKKTLTVTKTVTGNTGAHIATNLFGIRVTCTDTTVANFNLRQNQSATVEGKLGAVCTITEPGIPTLASPWHYAPNISPSKETLLDDVDVTVENEVTDKVTHLVIVTNEVDGPEPDKYNHAEKFTLVLNCAGSVKTSSMYVGGESSYSIPDGVNCSVTTTVRPTPNLTPIEYEWVNSKTVYSLGVSFVTRDFDETLTATHWLQRVGDAPVTVVKTLAGNTALYLGGTFDVTLTCASGFTETFPFAPTGTETRMLPIGDVCTVTEDTSNAILASGTPRRTIAPYQFTVGDDGQTVYVETELLDAPITRAQLYVTKEITGIMAGHNPAAVFEIKVTCPGTSPSVKTLNLQGGQSGMTDAMIGDTCTITEPTVPTAKLGYMYAPTVAQSLSIPADRREATVINEVIVIGPTVEITFTQATVMDVAGSGYVPGILNTTVNCGVDRADNLSLAEGEWKTVTVPTGTVCSLASAAGLPPLNSGFAYIGPTMNPALPYTAAQNGIVTINYSIVSTVLPRMAPEPIPTLDPKALLLLIGLLSGLMLWQRRQLRRQARRQS
jgi:hypothetical protein